MKSKRKSSFFFHVLGISFFPDTYFYCKEKKNRIQMIRFPKLRTHQCLNLMTLVNAFAFFRQKYSL